ncbi:MAG: glycosyl transferase [Marinisporobacter sp.]|jgi:UDP-N-acetylmuramyl pentapeptide phosphotransferase/UDP-N-acetylglucosamine-1-phosphate transferase|nr:glycosyl transferase [Marinisporobacter sp.]
MLIRFSCLFLGFVFTKLMVPMFMNLLYETECIKNNYRGENIPVGMGLVFIPGITSLVIFLLLCLNKSDFVYVVLFLVGTLGMGLAGLLDDLLGNRNVTGLKGHFKKLLKFELTTGGFKAAFGGLLSVAISVIISHNIVDIFMNTLIIALFTNFINLLDLRPGRALKGFLVTAIILILSPIYKEFRFLMMGLIGCVLAYIPYDLKAKSMMGDVGSNILGISLGIVCSSLDFSTRMIALSFLILLHLYTEKYSLTKTIEKVKILKYFDEIGR